MTDEEAQKVLAALGDSVRFEIFRKLLEVADLYVADFASRLRPSTLSYHLQVMEQAGLVYFRRDGRRNRYSLRHDTLSEFAKWAQNASELSIFAELANELLLSG